MYLEAVGAESLVETHLGSPKSAETVAALTYLVAAVLKALGQGRKGGSQGGGWLFLVRPLAWREVSGVRGQKKMPGPVLTFFIRIFVWIRQTRF